MRDGAAERGMRGGGGIGVDELAILGGVGEGIDARLVDEDPLGDADLGADAGANIVEGSDRHGLS